MKTKDLKVKWEYCEVIRPQDQIQSRLEWFNAMGHEGWELVYLETTGCSSAGYVDRMILKRKIKTGAAK